MLTLCQHEPQARAVLWHTDDFTRHFAAVSTLFPQMRAPRFCSALLAANLFQPSPCLVRRLIATDLDAFSACGLNSAGVAHHVAARAPYTMDLTDFVVASGIASLAPACAQVATTCACASGASRSVDDMFCLVKELQRLDKTPCDDVDCTVHPEGSNCQDFEVWVWRTVLA